MTYEYVKVTREANVEIIAMNRPEIRNSLNRQLRAELKDALSSAMADDSVRVVVLAGEGKGFCAGADLAEEKNDTGEPGFLADAVRDQYNGIIETIVNGQKPVVCAVNGVAAGFAGALVMACDLIVMAEDAFIFSAFSGIGLVPDGGFHFFLRNAVGPQKAYEVIAFCERLDAKQCEEYGIANRVVASESLREEALALAARLSRLAPLSLRHSKQLLKEAATSDPLTIASREADFQEINLRSEDHQEGVKAFFEKRDAEFKGH